MEGVVPEGEKGFGALTGLPMNAGPLAPDFQVDFSWIALLLSGVKVVLRPPDGDKRKTFFGIPKKLGL